MTNDEHEYIGYHESLTEERHTLKDRIRNLVKYWKEDSRNTISNWRADGEWKESALRTVLLRHLPSEVFIGRGFILFKSDSSTQLDITVLRPHKPTVFKDGEFVIVTPDAPGALIEVKTSLTSRAAVEDAITKLCEIGRKCKDLAGRAPWLGLFVYDSSTWNDTELLTAARCGYCATQVPINCISYGKDLFVRFWKQGEHEHGDRRRDASRGRWRSYKLKNVAPSYFIGNIVDAICGMDSQKGDYAWFTHRGGKRPYMLNQMLLQDSEQEQDGINEDHSPEV